MQKLFYFQNYLTCQISYCIAPPTLLNLQLADHFLEYTNLDHNRAGHMTTEINESPS